MTEFFIICILTVQTISEINLQQYDNNMYSSGLSKYYKDTQTTQRHAKSHKDTQRRAKTRKDVQRHANFCVSLSVFVCLCQLRTFFFCSICVSLCVFERLCPSLPVFACLCVVWVSLRYLDRPVVFFCVTRGSKCPKVAYLNCERLSLLKYRKRSITTTLKKTKIGFQYQLLLNSGQKSSRMLKWEHPIGAFFNITDLHLATICH